MRKKLIKSEVTALFQTTKETLRHYERVGLLKPEIDENNYRYYGFKDLAKLRQIFFLRDIDLSIQDMQRLERKTMDKATYLRLLEDHATALQKKIDHLCGVKNSVEQLLKLEKETAAKIAFMITPYKERYLYVYDNPEGVEVSAKAYYDSYKDRIEANRHSERRLQMLYPYEALGSGEPIDARLCIEHPEKVAAERGSVQILPPGDYLSVYYAFEEGGFEGLPALKEAIEGYLTKEGLKKMTPDVMEIEHPELALFEEGTSMIYELQLHVERCDRL